MSSRINDIEFLTNLVESGKSLRTIHGIINCGPKFTLNKLKQFGLADKDLKVSDCKVPGWGSITEDIRARFPYEDYIKYMVEGGMSQRAVAKSLGVRQPYLRYAISKYKKQFEESQSKAAVQEVL